MNFKKQFKDVSTQKEVEAIFAKAKDIDGLVDFMINHKYYVSEETIYKYIGPILEARNTIVEVQHICDKPLSSKILLRLFSVLVKDSYDLQFILHEYNLPMDVLMANAQTIIKILHEEPWDFVPTNFKTSYETLDSSAYDDNDDHEDVVVVDQEEEDEDEDEDWYQDTHDDEDANNG